MNRNNSTSRYKIILRTFVFSIFCASLTGCLVTRNEVKEQDQRTQIQQQVVTLQRTNADVNNRFTEIESAVRELSGKVDSFDRKIESTVAADNRSLFEVQKTQNAKLSDLQESLSKLETQVNSLANEIRSLRNRKDAEPENKPESPQETPKKKDTLESANQLFKNREWSKAALEYQKYRDENPHSKKLSEVTYRMAFAFQQLGMKDEAKTFYQDVVAKYPASEEAKKAKLKLKALK